MLRAANFRTVFDSIEYGCRLCDFSLTSPANRARFRRVWRGLICSTKETNGAGVKAVLWTWSLLQSASDMHDNSHRDVTRAPSLAYTAASAYPVISSISERQDQSQISPSEALKAPEVCQFTLLKHRRFSYYFSTAFVAVLSVPSTRQSHHPSPLTLSIQSETSIFCKTFPL